MKKLGRVVRIDIYSELVEVVGGINFEMVEMVEMVKSPPEVVFDLQVGETSFSNVRIPLTEEDQKIIFEVIVRAKSKALEMFK